MTTLTHSQAQARAANITNLPVEITVLICENICFTQRNHDGRTEIKGQADLSRFSRTCKPIRDVAQRMLFGYFRAKDSKLHGLSFLRSIHERPDLADAVQRVSLFNPGLEFGCDHSEWAFIQKVMDDLGFENRSPSEGDPESIRNLLPELILMHTRKVKHILLAIENRSTLEYLRLYGNLLVAKGEDQAFLPALKSLDVRHFFFAGDCFDVPFDEIAFGILRAAPAVEYLSLPSFEAGGSWILPEWNGGDEVANLRELHLGPNCAASPDLIEKMVASCPRLESFRLHWTPADSSDRPSHWEGGGKHWTVAYMWEILQKSQCRHTLREIALDVRADTLTGQLMLDGVWSGLGEFSSLEVLKLDFIALLPLLEAWRRSGEQERQSGGLLSQLLMPFRSTLREVVFWKLSISTREFRNALEKLAVDVEEGRFLSLRRVVVGTSARPEIDDAEPSSDWGWPEWAVDEWNEAVKKWKKMFARGGVEYVVEENRELLWSKGTGMF